MIRMIPRKQCLTITRLSLLTQLKLKMINTFLLTGLICPNIHIIVRAVLNLERLSILSEERLRDNGVDWLIDLTTLHLCSIAFKICLRPLLCHPQQLLTREISPQGSSWLDKTCKIREQSISIQVNLTLGIFCKIKRIKILKSLMKDSLQASQHLNILDIKIKERKSSITY